MPKPFRSVAVAACLLATFVAPSALAAEPDAPAALAKGEEAKPAATSEEDNKAALDAMRDEKKRLDLELALERQRQQRELAAIDAKKRAIEAQLQLERAERSRDLFQLEAESKRLTAQRRVAEAKLAIERLKVQSEVAKVEGQQKILEAQRKARLKVTSDIRYRPDPFHDGVLEITDRRVPLNGVITMATADAITQKLHFFNNQSAEHPIFLVIDYSPGGSVMAGYRILEAIEASKAPVHVIVKSFAASMAAVITTRAPHSYAYPNAMLLHHQISSGNGGNLTQQTERLKESAEWSRRLLGPVHRKMGLSHDQLVKRMYEEDSDGDWKVFADEARRLKWVDHIVRHVRETGVASVDDKIMNKGPRAEVVDGKLPALLPSDHWFLHNPGGFYR